MLPGFGASDLSTVPLRRQLRLLGHPVHGWQLGRNEGPTPDTIEGLGARVRQLTDRYDRPIALVGWSLGGVYAWNIARRDPDRVRLVVTLGSPLGYTESGSSPLPVPLTSIWSRNDRIVRWPSPVIEEGHRRENIEVRATHLTLGFDPFVLAAIADRLVQRGDDWKPFRPPRWLDAAYPR